MRIRSPSCWSLQNVQFQATVAQKKSCVRVRHRSDKSRVWQACTWPSRSWEDLSTDVLPYQFTLKQMRVGFTGIRAFRRPLYLVPQPSTLLWRNERWWVAWKPNFGLLTYFYRNFEGTPRRSTISSLFKRKILYFICSFTSTSFDSAYAVSRHPNLWCIFRRPACHSSDFWLIPEWCFIVTSWQTACQWGIRWRKPGQEKDEFLEVAVSPTHGLVGRSHDK